MNKVNELAVWDFAESFTALDAVGLILGVGNHHSLTWHEKEPPYKRMTQAFEAAKEQLHRSFMDADIPFNGDRAVQIPVRIQINLHSLRDEKARAFPTDDTFAWACIEQIDEAVFSRDEIHRWLIAINAKSQYSFSLPAQVPELAMNDKNPPVIKNSPSLHPRAETTYLNIIGALLAQLTSGKKNDTTVITQAVNDYGSKPGISQRKLQEAFALAKRSLEAS